MKKRGFTLIELLAVIVILAVIAIIATPAVLNIIEDSKKGVAEASARNIVATAKNYYLNEIMNGRVVRNIDLSYETIKYGGEQATKGYVEFTNSGDASSKMYINGYCVEVNINGDVTSKKVDEDDCSITYPENIEVKPNSPKLFSNMIPVTYNQSTSKWTYADTTSKWYDYENKQWANAVLLVSNPSKQYSVGNDIEMDDIAQMYVWIPRYKYVVFNANNESLDEQVIEVVFERGAETTGTVKCHDVISGTAGQSSEVCTDSTNGLIVNGKSTYTHPAFCFGRKNEDGSCSGTELTGIWVAKFEVSGAASATELKVKPNEKSLLSISLPSFFNAMNGVSNSYNIKDENQVLADSHMIKNMEWGAVAYLQQSKYGIGITDMGVNNYYVNDAPYFMTGCGSAIGTTTTTTTCEKYDTANGVLASTTGNIYGIYDMSGGAWEYVMGNMVDTSGNFYVSDTESFSPNVKYYDSYSYNNSDITHGRGKLGDSTKETLRIFGNSEGGWYSDYLSFPSSNDSCFLRGARAGDGSKTGIFAFGSLSGMAYKNGSSRLVITQQ